MVEIKVLLSVENPVLYAAVHDDIRHQRLRSSVIKKTVLHRFCTLAVKRLPWIVAVKCKAYVISDILVSRFKKALGRPELAGSVSSQLCRDNSRAVHDCFLIPSCRTRKRRLRFLSAQPFPASIFFDCRPEWVLLRIRQCHKRICDPERTFRAAVILYHREKLAVKSQ